MRHPSDEQLCVLARKIIAEADLSAEEAALMGHAADCDGCYSLLCSMMSMQEVAAHMSEVSAKLSPEDLQIPMESAVSAVIRLAVRAVNSVLDQMEETVSAWTFRKAPTALAGARSHGKDAAHGTKKLTDAANSSNFVAYDPAKKLLMIQIDGRDGLPYAGILLPNGEQREIRFVQREHLYWAEVPDLEEGEYQLLLQKEFEDF